MSAFAPYSASTSLWRRVPKVASLGEVSALKTATESSPPWSFSSSHGVLGEVMVPSVAEDDAQVGSSV